MEEILPRLRAPNTSYRMGGGYGQPSYGLSRSELSATLQDFQRWLEDRRHDKALFRD